METILAIAGAGALGCVSRYLLAQGIFRWLGQGFPLGILVVNVLGCALIGFLATILLERWQLGPAWRAGILIGFLGGFTTFSSFTLDTISLFSSGENFKALLYVILSVVLCLLATWSGMELGRNL